VDFFIQLFTDPVGFYHAHQLLLGQIGVNALLALSMGVTLRCGMLSQANVGFMAIGAYTSVLLHVHYAVPFWLGLPAAALAAGVVAVPIGFPVLRLSGIFLAIATIGFGQVVVAAILNVPFTGEGQGLVNVDADASIVPVYLTLAVTAYILWRLYRSRSGEAWAMIREDAMAAEAHGVDVFRHQLGAFVIGALIAGWTGALDAHLNFFVDPSEYQFSRVVAVLVFAVVGGSTTVLGPMVGAGLLTTMPEVLRFARDYRGAVYGLVLLAVVLLRPQGLIGRARDGGPTRRLIAVVVALRRPAQPESG